MDVTRDEASKAIAIDANRRLVAYSSPPNLVEAPQQKTAKLDERNNLQRYFDSRPSMSSLPRSAICASCNSLPRFSKDEFFHLHNVFPSGNRRFPRWRKKYTGTRTRYPGIGFLPLTGYSERIEIPVI